MMYVNMSLEATMDHLNEGKKPLRVWWYLPSGEYQEEDIYLTDIDYMRTASEVPDDDN